MAKKRSKRSLVPKQPIASFKGTKEFAEWLESFATARRVPVSVLLEHALVAFANQEGYDPPPER